MGQSFTLFRLQQIDSRRDVLSNRLREIDLFIRTNTELQIAENKYNEAENQFQRIHKEVELQEQNVYNQRIKIEQSEAALYGGKIRNPKELQDLENELASLKKYLVVLEERLLENMLILENAESSLSSAKIYYINTIEKFKQQRIILEEEKISVQSEYDRLNIESEACRNTLSADEISLYDNLREKRRGKAVATVVDGTCSACGSTLSASLLQSAKMMNQITLCNSCGRILYWGS